MPSNTYPQIKGITAAKGYTSLPATPTLLSKLNINSPRYEIARQNEINNKKTNQIHDIRLRPYQNDAVNFIINSRNTGLAVFDEQRLGKTPTVLTALKILQASPIIVVPHSLLYQWTDEYKLWYNDNVLLVEGTPSQRQEIYKQGKPLIISYNTLSRDIDIILKYVNKYNYLVIDEAHRIRNIKKSRKTKPAMAKAVIKLASHVKTKIALTGTPSANIADDIFGILQFLYPALFKSYYSFVDYYFETETVYIKHASMDTISKSTGIFKPNKEKELLEFLELISIQRKRKEVMEWLPDYDITFMWLPMDKAQIKAHEELSKYFEYKDTVCLDTLSLILAQRQIATAPELLDCNTPGCKFKYIKTYLEDYPEKSIIIVSTLVEPLKCLKAYLNIESPMIIGSTPPKLRNEIKNKFQTGQCKLLLANLTVIKEGFTLDTADTIIFLESSYIYTDNLQCMDRLVPVKKENVHSNIQEIKILGAKDSIDEYIIDMVYTQKASSSDIINNYKKYLERSQNE